MMGRDDVCALPGHKMLVCFPVPHEVLAVTDVTLLPCILGITETKGVEGMQK